MVLSPSMKHILDCCCNLQFNLLAYDDKYFTL